MSTQATDAASRLSEAMSTALRCLRSPLTMCALPSDRIVQAYALVGAALLGDMPTAREVAAAVGRYNVCRWEGRDHEAGMWALVFAAIGVEP